MAIQLNNALRTQLARRRQKLENALASSPGRSDLAALLHEVDAALSRMDIGMFGLCEVCREPIESGRLAADPLLRFCLDHLTEPQQRALEQDLQLAAHRFFMTSHRLERMFLYFPSREPNGTPADIGLSFQDLTFVTDDQLKLHGWFVPCEGARKTLLIFHGNAGNIGHRLSWIALLHRLGVSVFIFDYRGYGKSEGQPFEEGLYRDARAAYQWWASERERSGEKLILVGESLGGAVAVHLAARVSPAGLVLQSTFTSARDMAKAIFPLGLLLPLTGVRFDSEKEIARVACPKLMIHGTRDGMVPFRLGQTLYEIAPPPKWFYVVPDAGHNDLLWVAGTEYSRQVQAFLSRIP